MIVWKVWFVDGDYGGYYDKDLDGNDLEFNSADDARHHAEKSNPFALFSIVEFKRNE